LPTNGKRAQSVARIRHKNRGGATGLRTINVETFGVNRSPGTTDGRKRNKNNVSTKNSPLDDNITVIDIRREGISEYNTTARTGSQGQGTVNSFRANRRNQI